MNLVQILAEQARLRPQAAAIVESCWGRDRMTTFADLEDRSRRLATLLRDSGIGPGHAVLMIQPMTSELYVLLLGVFRLGAVAMFLDPSAGCEHLEQCCNLQPPRALIASPKAHLLRISSGALRRIPRKFVAGPWLPGATPLQRARGCAPMGSCESCAPDTPALLTFTSGSTGLPKAAVRTHGFLLTQHRVLERHLKLIPGEVDLTTLPIFLLANLASGVTSVIPEADLRQPGSIEAPPVLRQMRRLRVARTAGSPAFFARLLEAEADAPTAFAGLEKVYTGGAPVFPKLLRQLQQAAPHAEVEAVYGSTEAEPIAHIAAAHVNALDHASMLQGRGLLAGVPIPEIQIAILRDQAGKPLGTLDEAEWDSLCQPTGSAGEIVVSGDHVLKGYLQGRGDEGNKFKVGGRVWHRTGDAGSFDSQGRLWLLGRCSARINDSHGVLYPLTVECVAQEQTGVRRAALVAERGRRLLAIEPDVKFTLATLKALRESLGWAHVADIRSLPALPVDKRHNAKIDYPALRRLLAR